MKLKLSYDSESAVPSEFKSAFTEKEGKFVLTGEIDVKTEADVQAVLDAKAHIKTELAEVKDKLKSFDGVKVDEYKSMQNELDVLRAKMKDGGADEETINAIVEKRLARETEAFSKEREELTSKLKDAEGFRYSTEKNKLISDSLKGKVSESIFDEASFVLDTHMERQADGTYLTKASDRFGLDAGLTAEQAVSKLTDTRKHWQLQNVGGGAQGNSGNQVNDKNVRYNDLLKKSQGGTANRQEMVELSSLAQEIKNGE
jgi:hypothetical protein